ncbi:hypothetical protein AVEN_9188-1 [Araneus ventricosus]|uniref:Uncharacterized protein n=1 Tax=Araneus ventricosus TaxID=182803 RepID=A0A4Y2JPN8_ARAVE|nr:hypothetical protein AVEN_9188-1 [Araneus ventricosus]
MERRCCVITIQVAPVATEYRAQGSYEMNNSDTVIAALDNVKNVSCDLKEKVGIKGTLQLICDLLKTLVNNSDVNSEAANFLMEQVAFLGSNKFARRPCSHLFKCISNNWLNQKNDGRCFFYPKFDSVHAVQDIADFKAARFATIRELCNLESDKLVKYGFRLKLKALVPSSMERRNVKLVLCIFNEHVTEALAELGEKNKLLYSKDTSDFLKIIIKWWQIVNVKTPNKGKRLNNSYQEPLSYDEKYIKMAFLEKFLKWIDDWERMKFSTGTFTKETMTAIVLSTKAIIEI